MGLWGAPPSSLPLLMNVLNSQHHGSIFQHLSSYHNTTVNVCRCQHLKFGHGAEMIVPEEDTQLSLLYGGGELTQAVVGQLSRCAVQKLLCHETWNTHTYTQGIKYSCKNVNWFGLTGKYKWLHLDQQSTF